MLRIISPNILFSNSLQHASLLMVLASNANFIIIITVLLFVKLLFAANFLYKYIFVLKEILKKWCQEPGSQLSSKNWLYSDCWSQWEPSFY